MRLTLRATRAYNLAAGRVRPLPRDHSACCGGATRADSPFSPSVLAGSPRGAAAVINMPATRRAARKKLTPWAEFVAAFALSGLVPGAALATAPLWGPTEQSSSAP